MQQIPSCFKKCISRENKLLRTQKSLNSSHFSLMPTGMQAFCLWCLCFFSTFYVTSQCFMASWTWCVWSLSLPFCRTFFLHLKQAGLQRMIPDAQKKFVRSLGALLYCKCLYCGKMTSVEIWHREEVYTSQNIVAGESLWMLRLHLVMQLRIKCVK